MEVNVTENEIVIRPKAGKQLNVELIDGQLIIAVN